MQPKPSFSSRRASRAAAQRVASVDPSAQDAQGLNVLRFDESGLISDLTVFFRPLGSLGLLAEVIGARLAERFGPPPE